MSSDSGELARNLGFLEAMTMGGGTMIGAGIFILPGIAAEGAGPASAISFAIAGFVALLAAISLSELATGMPIAGGSYHYVNQALGSLFGSIVGWGMWTGLMFASAFYMIGFGQYIVESAPFLAGRPYIILLGLIGLALLVGLNYYGTEESGSIQNILIGSETAIILVYLAAGVFFIDPTNLDPFAPTGASGVIATTGIVFVTFLGFEIIATVAEEVKNPGRNIPLTMILSVVLVTLLYMVVMVISTGVVPYGQLGESLVPVSDVAVVTMGTAGVVAIVAAAVVAAISSSNSSILAAARVVFAMGRDNLMSDWLNETHDTFRTPHRAVMATGAVTAALVLAGLRVNAIISLLAEVASFSFLVAYSLVHVAVVVIRRADPDHYEPDFKIPGLLYPAIPALGVVLSFVVISQMDPVVIAIGLGIVGLSVAWYAIYARRQDIEQSLLGEAVIPEPSESSAATEMYRVVVPVADPDRQKDLLEIAAASARINAEKDSTSAEVVAVNVVPVPSQTALEQNLQFEEERIESQRELLDAAMEAIDDPEVAVRTRAMLGRNIGETILTVLDEEAADQVVLGGKKTSNRREPVFGSTVDPVVRDASCDVTVLNNAENDIGSPVALAGPGPHAPVAARRAYELASITGTKPTLLNGQPTADDASDETPTPVEQGNTMIEEIAEQAGLNPDDYESDVRVADDVQTGILNGVEEYDTVCLGVSEKSRVSKILWGSLADTVARQADGNVAMVRGKYDTRTSLGEALTERISQPTD